MTRLLDLTSKIGAIIAAVSAVGIVIGLTAKVGWGILAIFAAIMVVAIPLGMLF